MIKKQLETGERGDGKMASRGNIASEQNSNSENINSISDTRHNPYECDVDDESDKVGFIETIKNILFVVQMIFILAVMSHRIKSRK